MKTKLLLLILPVLVLTSPLYAQDHVWDFGNDTTNWPENSSGVSTTTVVDGLTLQPGDASFAVIDGNNASWDAVDFEELDEDYSASQRFKWGGSSSVDPAVDGTDVMPTRRWMEIPVDGPVAVKIWFRASGSGTPRALWVTDGTSEVLHFDSTGSTDPSYIQANYTGGAGTLLVFCANNAFNVYKLEISSTLLSTNQFNAGISANIQAINDRVFVSNVSTATEIDIYSITGAKVKSFTTNSAIDFSFNSGLYIATLTTPQGQKSVKLLVH